MKYQLDNAKNNPLPVSLRRFMPYIRDEKKTVLYAFLATLATSATALAAPIVIGHAIDAYIQHRQFAGVLASAAVLFALNLTGAGAMYLQTKLMGTAAQHLLYRIRKAVFTKLQALPLPFFAQNKSGDLISRINNDTDTLNQFFSQSLVQFGSALFQMIGAAGFLVFLNWRLGLAALGPAAGLAVFTKLVSPWVRGENAKNLASTGEMSADISESLANFRLFSVFNRRDYLRSRFAETNRKNYRGAVGAGIANHTLGPVYGLAANLATLIVLSYGVFQILHHQLSIGLLVGYLSYVSRFYDPIRQVAGIWSTFQTALSGWDRITLILDLQSELQTVPSDAAMSGSSRIAFDHVTFTYEGGKTVLEDVTFTLEKGKTYAFVGPTGGGKTTTASLMARLFDPTQGNVFLDGRDIRSYSDAQRTGKIGFILQEPFLFSGTVRDNIVYGNPQYQNLDARELEVTLKQAGLSELLERFPGGMETPVTGRGATMSLGQQQLIAFMRAVLRRPELLILDEATANVDTVTEKLLDKIIAKLNGETTKVIIAHRFNTISHANTIFFVNGGRVERAGSLKHAMDLLTRGAHKS